MSRRRAPAVPAWQLGAVGFLVVLLTVGPLVQHWLSTPQDLRLVDLDVYRSAGRSLLIGRPVYFWLTPAPQLLPFTYPPVAAVLAIPLALLSWPVAQWVWTLAQVAVLAAVVAVAFRPALRRSGAWWPLVLGALVGAMAWLQPVRDGIRFGQVDVFLVALCLADCVTPAVRRRWPQGALVGLATAIKLTPGVFLVYLWLTGRRRAAVVGALTAAGVSLAAALVSPTDSVAFWAGALFDSNRLGPNDGTSNQSVRAWLLRTPIPHSVQSVLWLAGVALIAYFGFRRAQAASRAGDELLGVGLTGLLAVLLSPVAWIHHLAWVVLLVAVAADELQDTRHKLTALAIGGYFALKLPWYGAELLHGFWHPLGRLLQSSFGLAALALLLWLQPRVCRRPAPPGLRRSEQQEPRGERAAATSPAP